jgi:hypothetical protein
VNGLEILSRYTMPLYEIFLSKLRVLKSCINARHHTNARIVWHVVASLAIRQPLRAFDMLRGVIGD